MPIPRPRRFVNKWPCFKTAVKQFAPYVVPGTATVTMPCVDLIQGQLPELRRLLNTRLQPMTLADRREWVGQVHDVFDEAARVGLFNAYGAQCFVIAPGVVDALGRTELAEIQVEDVCPPPFPALYVELEHPFAAGGFALEGLYVRHDPKLGLNVNLCVVENRENAPDWAIEPTFTLELPLNGSLIGAVERQMLTNRERAERLRTDLEAGIDALGGNSLGIGVLRSTSEEKLAAAMETEQGFVERALTLSANILCLLRGGPAEMFGPPETWPRPAQPRPGAAHKTEKGALEVRYVSFGASGDVRGEGGGIGGISPRAHWRRGHWRRTPYGPAGDKVYQPRWIRPTLVNPEHGPAAEASVYRVAGQ